MKTRYAVGIVGSGVIGLAVARELARAGIRDVAIFDRHAAPGQGSTARANGGIRTQFTTPVNIAFSRYTIGELVALDREQPGRLGFVQAGYLFIAGRNDTAAALRSSYETQRRCDVDVTWLSPSKVMELAPFIRPDGIIAGTFAQCDGFIDPHGMIGVLSDTVRAAGGDLVLETAVTGLDIDGSRFGISTSAGRVEVDWLINAAGPEAREVACMLGVDLPIYPVRRNLATTETVSGPPTLVPMCVDIDTGVLIRREGRGFLIAYSNPDDSPGTDTSFDPRFLEQIAERISNRFPFLETSGIHPSKCWAGLYPETPDHHAIVGPSPGMPRFLQAVGFGGHGIMHSLAAGRALAELVAHGASTTLDIRPLRAERFTEGDPVIETAVL